jgi:hypothetical protein
MIFECGVVDTCAVSNELLLCCYQSTLGSFHGIPRMLQLLAGNSPRCAELRAAREIALRRGEIRTPNVDGRLQLRCGRKQVTHLSHSPRQLRFGLIERHFGVRLIEAHQRLTRFHELRVVGSD